MLLKCGATCFPSSGLNSSWPLHAYTLSTHVLVAQNAQQVTDRRLVSSVAQLDPQVQEPRDSVTANAG